LQAASISIKRALTAARERFAARQAGAALDEQASGIVLATPAVIWCSRSI
jgi:hypothetical protein